MHLGGPVVPEEYMMYSGCSNGSRVNAGTCGVACCASTSLNETEPGNDSIAGVALTYGTTHTADSDGSDATISRTRSRQSICLPAYQYPSATIRTLGAICPKRSSTPFVPKSGEHDDHTAPSDAAASIATTASGTFGR